MRTRTITNTGHPIQDTDGTILSDLRITFELVNERCTLAGSFDVAGEYIAPVQGYATTDKNGIFSITLPCTDTLVDLRKYLCTIDHPDCPQFFAPLVYDAASLAWSVFKTSGDTAPETVVDTFTAHIQNSAIHTPPSANHTHSNKTVLDNFSEISGSLAYNGSTIIGTPGTNGVDGVNGVDGINGTNGIDGIDGKSAYEIAVANGYVGNEASWLLSLKGATGATGAAGAAGTNGTNGTNGIDGVNGVDGINGTNGIDGIDGKSAYEVAVANGYVGNEASWLLSLKGATGATGATGAAGTNGTNGIDGINGTNGIDGIDGKSAYEVAVANGYLGTEAAWLLSLKGTTGAAGANGVAGAAGAAGADGLTTSVNGVTQVNGSITLKPTDILTPIEYVHIGWDAAWFAGQPSPTETYPLTATVGSYYLESNGRFWKKVQATDPGAWLQVAKDVHKEFIPIDNYQLVVDDGFVLGSSQNATININYNSGENYVTLVQTSNLNIAANYLTQGTPYYVSNDSSTTSMTLTTTDITGANAEGLINGQAFIILPPRTGVTLMQGYDIAQDCTTANVIASTDHSLVYSALTNTTIKANLFHGVVSRAAVPGSLPTSLSSTTFTLAETIEYYYKGVICSSAAGNYETLPTPALPALPASASNPIKYYIGFDNPDGVLKAEMGSMPDLHEFVIIATVIWNGTHGLVSDERHAYNRNITDHITMHYNIGTRYIAGLTLAARTDGTTLLNSTFSVTSGQINDEDIQFAISSIHTTARIWYQTGTTTWAFENDLSTRPYYAPLPPSDTSGVYFVHPTNHVLTRTSNQSTRFCNYFVYASTDLDNPIYILAETVSLAVAGTGGYTSAANARASAPPVLIGSNMSYELKLLYRIVVDGTGRVQTQTAADDYRSGGSIPGGGIATVLHDATQPQLAANGVVYGHVTVDNDTSKFLCGNGTWATPTGTGISNPMTTAGDIIVGGTSGALARLAKGSDGQVLKIISGNIAWGAETPMIYSTASTTLLSGQSTNITASTILGVYETGLVSIPMNHTTYIGAYGTALASSEYPWDGTGAGYAWKAFNGIGLGGGNVPYEGWSTTFTGADWVGYQFNVATCVTNYSLGRYYDSANIAPKTFKLQASNDNTNWTDLHSVTNLASWNASEIKSYQFVNSTAYIYYRIYITARFTGDASHVGISEVAFGYSTDLLLKSSADFRVERNATTGVVTVTNISATTRTFKIEYI